jgi:hypothetical protein
MARILEWILIRPVVSLLPVLLRTSDKELIRDVAAWFALTRGCMRMPAAEILPVLQKAFAASESSLRLRIWVSGVMAAQGDEPSLRWLVEQAGADEFPWPELVSVRWNFSRASPRLLQPILTDVVRKIEAGDIRPGWLMLISSVRSERTVSAVINAWEKLTDGQARNAMVSFLSHDGSVAALGFLATLPAESLRRPAIAAAAFGNPDFRKLIEARARNESMPLVDATVLAWIPQTAESACARLSSVPEEQVTSDLVKSLEFNPIRLQDLRSPGPQAGPLMVWLRSSKTASVRMDCVRLLIWLSRVLGGEEQVQVIGCLTQALEHEQDPELLEYMLDSVQHYLQSRRGQTDGQEIYEEHDILAGEFDDPDLLRRLDDAIDEFHQVAARRKLAIEAVRPANGF